VLIKDWREKFGGKEAPFYFVQLAPHRYVDQATEALPEVWDAQMQTFKTVNNVGMAVAVDVGNAKELRPKNKQVIGQRLALWALADNYLAEIPAEEKDFLFSGPIYESMATIDDKIRLTFSHTGDKLSASQSDEPLYNFEVCGEDKKFYPALAKVVDDVVVEVTSPDVENPIAVRFAWKDDCKPNLVNQGGLPAAPFRTDEFPLSSDGKHFAF
jgi:sialate O-acetylesterase